MNNYCVSIIVPIYNVEAYLRECIDSIVNQSYRNIQIILVNDGSTDGSGMICDEYAMKDDRIVVIHQENKGLVAARKAGLQEAVGEYVGFVDGDDYINVDMYELLLDYIISTNSDIVHTGYWLEKGKKKYKKVGFDSETLETRKAKKDLINGILSLENSIEPSICSKLFKRDVIMKAYKDVDESSSYGEDVVCFISSIINTKKISIWDKAFYHYRIRENSLSHGSGLNAIEKELLLYNNIKDVLLKYGIYEEYRYRLDYYLGMYVMRHMKKLCLFPFPYETYCFRYPELVQNKNIIIYGAGNVGKDYYSQLCRYTKCNIVAWVDKRADIIDYSYIEVKSPEIIEKIEFDLIIVAVLDKMDAIEIENELELRGVDKNNIIWKEPDRNMRRCFD